MTGKERGQELLVRTVSIKSLSRFNFEMVCLKVWNFEKAQLGTIGETSNKGKDKHLCGHFFLCDLIHLGYISELGGKSNGQ